MQHLVSHQDGSVSVVTAIPVRMVETSTGREVRILGLRTRDPVGDKPGARLLYGVVLNSPFGESASLEVGDENFDIATLEVDSIPGWTLVFPDIAEIVAKWHPDTQATVQKSRRIKKAEILQDRYFRNAWTDTGASLGVDMPRAREIHRNRMREVRAPLLADLDTQYMRADEAGNAALKATISAKKQLLRDVTTDPRIDSAKTPEELKAVWPVALGTK